MATYIALITESQVGETQIANSVERAQAFKDSASALGINVQAAYWTMGGYDGVLIFDAPDDETAAGAMFKLGSKGAVRTHTLRAFTADEMTKMLK